MSKNRKPPLPHAKIPINSSTAHPQADSAAQRRAAVLWAVALAGMSWAVACGYLRGLDQWMAQMVANMHSPVLDRPMRLVTALGGLKATLLALVGLGMLAWRRGRWHGVLILCGAFFLGVALETVLRLMVAQWRPDAVVVSSSMDMAVRLHLAGFPSGHGFRSAFLFDRLAAHWKGSRAERPVALACGLMIGLVGFSRLYLNRHWVSDVLGSWLVALVVLSLARRLEQTVHRRQSTVHSKAQEVPFN